MPKAYSLDLRERVVRFVEAGRSRHAAAAHFQVSVSFVVNLMKAYIASGRLAPKPSGGRRHAKLEPHRAFLLACVVRSKAPSGHWMTQTFVAGLRCDKLTAPFVVNAPMNRRIFETYVETQLAPALEKGDVVIMDNLPAHKSKAAEKAIKARGAWVLFLPPYSPDFNPIEMAFAKLKAHLRASAARTIDALWQEIGRIRDLFAPAECQNYFAAAG